MPVLVREMIDTEDPYTDTVIARTKHLNLQLLLFQHSRLSGAWISFSELKPISALRIALKISSTKPLRMMPIGQTCNDYGSALAAMVKTA